MLDRVLFPYIVRAGRIGFYLSGFLKIMHTLRSLLGIFSIALLTLTPALATDVIESIVLAHDRVANVIVLKDKTVWPLDLLTQPLPDDLRAGDKVEIRYESNEDDGIQTIHSILRIGQ